MAAAVSVTSAITGVDPASIPFSTSSAVIWRSSSSTSCRPRDLGSMIPPGRAGMTAARSSAVQSPSSGLTRTHSRARSSLDFLLRNCVIAPRASALPLSTTASSRSKITMSASLSLALVIFLSLSPGAKSQLRMRIRGSGIAVMRVLETQSPAFVKHALAYFRKRKLCGMQIDGDLGENHGDPARTRRPRRRGRLPHRSAAIPRRQFPRGAQGKVQCSVGRRRTDQ